jgi:hypothetical protein
MSENIGNIIPPPLRFELGTEQGADQLGRAVLLVTTDDDGSPRVAVLSYAEIGALDERRASIKVNEGTRAHYNLAAGRDATVWCVLDSAAYSLRGSVAVSGDRFELTVKEVLRDFYPESPMMSGPMYRRLK